MREAPVTRWTIDWTGHKFSAVSGSSLFLGLNVFSLGTFAIITSSLAQTNTLDRPCDPVVINGQSLPALLSVASSNIVAFRFHGVWEQIPVQVDERRLADFGVIYGNAPNGIAALVYADNGTYTGADTNALFDADDELVFMAQDAGDRAPANACFPVGTLTNSPVELTLTDPLTNGIGWVYLFRSDGSLDPAAGKDYVNYQFTLLAGTYPENYNLNSGPNPENSVVSNAWYRTHFSDRWIQDKFNIYAGGASGVNILDRHKNLFAPGVCNRSEDTFSAGEGAFIANKNGPVRAIRSYLGANSGPLTQRDHFFYERRQDLITHLRVHLIPGVVDFYDYSPDATGMIYYNSLNTNGVTIDGVPDTVTAGAITWEMVTGAQGSLITMCSVLTDITPFAYTSYYSDDSTPSVSQCTGDAYEYGTSGPWINQAIPNTDPSLGATNFLTFVRTDYYDAPGQSVATAEWRQLQANTPIQVATTNFHGDADCDGLADAWELNYFGELSFDSSADNDHDGVSNLSEYVAGSNPTNSTSFPWLDIAWMENQAEISFPAPRAEGIGYEGLSRYFTLERIQNLDETNWEPISGFTDILGDNQTVTYSAPLATQSAFYRLRIRLQ